MARITDYKIVSAFTHQELEEQVTGLLAQGYRPHGSLIVIEVDKQEHSDKKHFRFLQPVVREE